MIRSPRRCHLISYFSFFLGIALLWPIRDGTVIAERQKLPQDNGIAGLEQMLRKLQTTARMIHTTAHPDDEDGGLLALESRGRGASVLLLTLNRGEGGQNKTGSELFDALGVLRTLELQAADDFYGVEQRFTRVVDFGFSKNAEETFNKWQGHDIALADMVRVIRAFRPDVLVSRFQGAARDGHGNHQAAGLLSREAFKAAGDPARFPEHIKEGLQPWQPKKLYVDNVRPTEDYDLKIDSGAYDPALGTSYHQFALEGLGHQLSQGAGGTRAADEPHFTYYKLIDSVLPRRPAKSEQAQSFFDDIDTSLTGLASRLGVEEAKAPFLRPVLLELQRHVNQAIAAFAPADPSQTAGPLLSGLKILHQLITQTENASLSQAAKTDLLIHLRTKRGQFEQAAHLALGLSLEVFVDAAGAQPAEAIGFPTPQQTFQMATPGQTFTLTARLNNRGRQKIVAQEIQLETPPGWPVTALETNLKTLATGESAFVKFQVTVPSDAAHTRPYWHRHNLQTETIYTLDASPYATLSFPPYPVRARARYSLSNNPGSLSAVAQVKSIDPLYGQEQHPLVVGPPLSVVIQPPTQILSTHLHTSSDLTVSVRNSVAGAASATLRLEVPSRWQVEPNSQFIAFTREGELHSIKFKVTPPPLQEGSSEIRAVAESSGKSYSEGYTRVTRRDLGLFYYYQPAVERVSAVAVKTPKNLNVGYVMGAGDDIAAVLKQLGINVEVITPALLATGDLTQYDTIILGIRAYDVRSDVRESNARLLDFVSQGGTLIVQYNQATSTFNAGQYTPYPASASSQRVSVEEAPVEMLVPEDPIFHSPNEITAQDFEGWVQERGLYFMNKWDERFIPLLASHDPGEPPLPGGLLRARYGKGTYIFTGYAFFRQLPAGVPGAIRLFVNLVTAGHHER